MGKQAAWASKKYKGHCTIPKNILLALNASGVK
jgi:hypothetical protein